MTAVPLQFTHPRFRRGCHAGAILMYLVVLVAGSVPGERAAIGQYATGTRLHSTAYAVLACLCYLGSAGQPVIRSIKVVLAVALMGVELRSKFCV
jgi:hypothetical protein